MVFAGATEDLIVAVRTLDLVAADRVVTRTAADEVAERTIEVVRDGGADDPVVDRPPEPHACKRK
jgi:hypothetical protein